MRRQGGVAVGVSQVRGEIYLKRESEDGGLVDMLAMIEAHVGVRAGRGAERIIVPRGG